MYRGDGLMAGGKTLIQPICMPSPTQKSYIAHNGPRFNLPQPCPGPTGEFIIGLFLCLKSVDCHCWTQPFFRQSRTEFLYF